MIAYLIGWAATALYLAAQAYISLKPDYNKPLYYLMNIVAGSALALASVAFESWQAVAVNIYWALISGLVLTGALAEFRLDLSKRFQISLSGLVIIVIAAWALMDSGIGWVSGLGWIGTFLYCGSYFVLSIGSLSRIAYLWVNAGSGALLLPVYMQTDNWPSFTLNVVWIIISVVGATRGDEQQIVRVAPVDELDP